ncbi:hypothetical protein ACWGJT_15645 [Streptomyces xantholiticus]
MSDLPHAISQASIVMGLEEQAVDCPGGERCPAYPMLLHESL